MKHPNPAIETLLASLANAKIPVIDLSLDRMLRLLAALGNPQENLPPVVHVAGTNGKGSLLAYMWAIMEAAGYKVHRYTSPHLVRFNERILLAGEEISDDYLHALLMRVKTECDRHPVTVFEATTALAFLAYAQTKADIVLLETGMGGRFDATNVLTAPLLTAITPVSMDHMDYLGNTLAAITAEKAGIIKSGVPCIVGPQQDEASAIIERQANKESAPVFRYNAEWSVKRLAQGLCYTVSGQETLYPLPNLAGEHQIYNAGTAIACIKQLKNFTISDAHIAYGITHTHWPARLQHLQSGFLASLVPPSSQLWLDGGHNAGAGQELAAWMAQQNKPVHIVCGMLTTKNIETFLKPMVPYICSLTGISIDSDLPSHSGEMISTVAQQLGTPSTPIINIKNAIEHIVKINNNDIIILICGSLLLAGDTLWQNSTGA